MKNKELKETKEIKIKKEKYIWWKDKKILGMILLILVSSFQVMAWLKIYFFTTIIGYTINMFFGYCNPLFFIPIIFISLQMMSNRNLKFPLWIRLNKKNYWIFSLILLFAIGSMGYYQSSSSWTTVGLDNLKVLKHWNKVFRNQGNAWFPNMTLSGLIGALLHTIISFAFTGVFTMFLAIIGALVLLSILFTGNGWNLYVNIIKKRRFNYNKKYINYVIEDDFNVEFKQTKTKEISNIIKDDQKEKDLTFQSGEKNIIEIKKPKAPKDIITNEKEEKNKNDIPFDDPFAI